jgi:Domain of unknown function (DUF4276)
MVKIGFIVEGATEKIILDSTAFRSFLTKHQIDFVPNVIDAVGNGNLLPKNVGPFISRLTDQGATIIFVLTDLDEDQCITLTKQRLELPPDHFAIVSVKQIESWFLADSEAMSRFLNTPNFLFDNPESLNNPFTEIEKLRLEKMGRGLKHKKVLANQLVYKFNFSIETAANHPNCPSAKYFLTKLLEVANR